MEEVSQHFTCLALIHQTGLEELLDYFSKLFFHVPNINIKMGERLNNVDIPNINRIRKSEAYVLIV